MPDCIHHRPPWLVLPPRVKFIRLFRHRSGAWLLVVRTRRLAYFRVPLQRLTDDHE